MKKNLKPAERLIVAADFDGGPEKNWRTAYEDVLKLAKALKGTGAIIKANSVLRAAGYELINNVHMYGVGVFADLKLCDILNTLATDGGLISGPRPEILTVMCPTGAESIRALKAALPHTEVIGVTVLTSFKEADAQQIFRSSVETAVMRLAFLGIEAGIDGIVCSPKEASEVRREFGDSFTINTPAIRPAWSVVAGDDQNQDRIMTPAKAIMAGADRIIVGRPIVQAADPREAALRTIDEIASALG